MNSARVPSRTDLLKRGLPTPNPPTLPQREVEETDRVHRLWLEAALRKLRRGDAGNIPDLPGRVDDAVVDL